MLGLALMMSPRIALPGIVLSAAMIFGVTLLAAIQTLLRSYQALWETNSVFKRARNLWIRGLPPEHPPEPHSYILVQAGVDAVGKSCQFKLGIQDFSSGF